MNTTQKQTHRSVPIQETITKISGYPDKLVIFKLNASSYWWVRYYTQKKILKKSTKTEHKQDAIKFAKKFYEDVLLKERNLLPLSNSPSFERCANELIAEQQQKINRGELNPRLNENDSAILNKHLLPFFRLMDIRSITYKHINNYLDDISKHKLSPSTLKKHTNLINKILKIALRENIIERTPPIPSIKLDDSPRGWFSNKEYEQLKNTTLNMINERVIVRGHLLTKEMMYLITFMTNTFLRPSDLKILKHRNIEIVRNDNSYLRISTESSKTINHPIVSMEYAIGIYEDICGLRTKVSKDDYVFLPEITNRDFAMTTISRLFNEILKTADLKIAPHGEPRTLYSLRHTAIMFRLTMGDHIDLLTLARNARTSVEMIERFYAKPLSAEMNIDKLQSMRR